MHLPSPGLSRLAIATAVMTLILMAVGALVYGPNAGDTATLPAWLARAGLTSGRYHIYFAIGTATMVVLLLIGLVPANVPAWLRATGWVAIALFAADSAIMALSPVPPVGAWLAIPHAILAALFLATVVTIAFYMPQDWINGPEMVDMTPWP